VAIRTSPAAMAHLLTDGQWEWPDHLDILSKKLVEVVTGKCKRLGICMPPQNGKSKLASHWFPTWFLDLFPDRKVVLISYGAEYAESWGRQVRDTIIEFKPFLNVQIAEAHGAAGEWGTTKDGGMVSTGIGGIVTGRRADLLIFDDPFKNHEEANSETQRQKVWDFFLSAAYTRLTPDGAIIVIMTRWHEDDLIGRLKKHQQDGGEEWEWLELPAIAESADDPLGRLIGQPLWPGRWPIDALHRIQRMIGTYFFTALYQQRPQPREGNYFKRAWFDIVSADRVPADIRWARSWDLAATDPEESGGDPDWIAGCRMGKCQRTGEYFIGHMVRDQLAPRGVESLIKQTAIADSRRTAIRVEQEGAASGKLTAHHFTRMLDGWPCRFVPVPRSGKFLRSAAFNAACERGDVKLVEGSWVQAFLDEAADFPTGKHDDQVDAAVGAYEELQRGLFVPTVSAKVRVFR
jgi:predicted phage terminase large subunit-like protein